MHLYSGTVIFSALFSMSFLIMLLICVLATAWNPPVACREHLFSLMLYSYLQLSDQFHASVGFKKVLSPAVMLLIISPQNISHHEAFKISLLKASG